MNNVFSSPSCTFKLARQVYHAVRHAILAFTIIGFFASAACWHGRPTGSSYGPGRPLNQTGAIDSTLAPGEVWAEMCLIHRPCERISPLPLCPRDMRITSLPGSNTSPEDNSEMVFSVAGRLLEDRHIESTAVACSSASGEQPCCNHTSKEAILAGENEFSIRLPNVGCFGDESRLCCNVIVTGQRVVATGLAKFDGQGGGQRAFFTGSVELCAY